jgi:hypothetical protein
MMMTTKIKDEKVQYFLDELEAFDPEKFAIISRLRRIVFVHFPDVNERIIYGGIMFSLKDDFGGLFAYKHHVSFEFSNGYKMHDPEKMLEGKGKFRRHLKIRLLEDIDAKKTEFFVQQIESECG